MSPKPKDDREEPVEGGTEASAAEGDDAAKASAYGRRTITRSGKFPKTGTSPSKSSTPPGKSQPAVPVAREEGKLMGSTNSSRYTLVAPRTGKKKKSEPPAE